MIIKNKEAIKSKLVEFITTNKYEMQPSPGIVSPYFKDEFNLSAGHQFVLPILHNNDKVELKKQATIEWCIRKDDIDRIGYTNIHLACFEMAVLGYFGFIEDRRIWQKLLFKQLTDFFLEIGLDKNSIYFTITNGSKIMDVNFEKDLISYNALIDASIETSKIIYTTGRQNFVFSKGEGRASGYNVEVYYLYNDSFIEIASSNIYQYLLINNQLIKSINTGLGFGIGLERLEMIINKWGSVYNSEYFQKRIDILHHQIPDKLDRELIYQKLIKIVELNKTLEHIDYQMKNLKLTINKKQQKAYNFLKAKLKSEVDFLQIDISKIKQ